MITDYENYILENHFSNLFVDQEKSITTYRRIVLIIVLKVDLPNSNVYVKTDSV